MSTTSFSNLFKPEEHIYLAPLINYDSLLSNSLSNGEGKELTEFDHLYADITNQPSVNDPKMQMKTNTNALQQSRGGLSTSSEDPVLSSFSRQDSRDQQVEKSLSPLGEDFEGVFDDHPNPNDDQIDPLWSDLAAKEPPVTANNIFRAKKLLSIPMDPEEHRNLFKTLHIPCIEDVTAVSKVVPKRYHARRLNPDRDSVSPTPSDMSTVTNSNGKRPMSVASSGWGSAQTKQAVYAREYRQKNKQIVNDLEGEIGELKEVNNSLRAEVHDSRSTILDLRQEVDYLRSVLANDSSLASLIQDVQNKQGIKFKFPIDSGEEASPSKTSSTRAGGKRPLANPATDAPHSKRPNKACAPNSEKSNSAGVCLHVRHGAVSVEFCGRCSQQSRCVSRVTK